METKRDPRVGQVWRKGKRTRTVMALQRWRGPMVSFQTPSDKRTRTIQVWRLDKWREWARGAEVIHHAG
jgi:hypothetical protein